MCIRDRLALVFAILFNDQEFSFTEHVELYLIFLVFVLYGRVYRFVVKKYWLEMQGGISLKVYRQGNITRLKIFKPEITRKPKKPKLSVRNNINQHKFIQIL